MRRFQLERRNGDFNFDLSREALLKPGDWGQPLKIKYQTVEFVGIARRN